MPRAWAGDILAQHLIKVIRLKLASKNRLHTSGSVTQQMSQFFPLTHSPCELIKARTSAGLHGKSPERLLSRDHLSPVRVKGRHALVGQGVLDTLLESTKRNGGNVDSHECRLGDVIRGAN